MITIVHRHGPLLRISPSTGDLQAVQSDRPVIMAMNVTS